MFRNVLTPGTVIALAWLVSSGCGSRDDAGLLRVALRANVSGEQPMATDAGAGTGGTNESGTTAVDSGAPKEPVTTSGSRLMVTLNALKVHIGQAGTEGANETDVSRGNAAPKGGTSEGEAAGGNSGWITVLSNPMTLNLFDVAETERLIATAQLPAGRITQIRLVLSDNVELVNGDSQISVACPSCATSGLKLVPKTPLAVPANGSVDVTLQMDASLLAGTSGQYMLHPVISVTD